MTTHTPPCLAGQRAYAVCTCQIRDLLAELAVAIARAEAAEQEIATVRERIAADPDESTIAALDDWFREKKHAERALNEWGERAERAEAALSVERKYGEATRCKAQLIVSRGCPCPGGVCFYCGRVRASQTMSEVQDHKPDCIWQSFKEAFS